VTKIRAICPVFVIFCSPQEIIACPTPASAVQIEESETSIYEI